jgi:uncharacterized protein with NAD-binding domain and iron-sulfur cluster
MVTDVDHLLFSAGTHLSVYADLPRVSPDYHAPGGDAAGADGLGGRSIVELVVAPAGDLIRQPDADVVAAILHDFYRLHPLARDARLRKYTLVRIPNSVYQARPGVDMYRPDQATPVPNLFLAGDYTQQEFMASIEGAVRSAKRAVERVDRAVVRDQMAELR